MKYLLDKGVVDKDGECLAIASSYGDLYMVKLLMDNLTYDPKDIDNALFSTTDLDIMKYLVGQGANIHAGNDGAVRDASMRGDLDIVKYLVEQGVDVYARDDPEWARGNSFNAVEWAKQKGHQNVIDYLESIT